jgi:hypothetical protein
MISQNPTREPGVPKTAVAMLAAAWLAAAWLFAATSAEAQASVQLDVTLEGMTVLHYYNDLDVTIDSAALSQALGFGGQAVDEGTAKAVTVSSLSGSGGGGLTLDVGAATDDPPVVDLTIRNVWALRSITAGGVNTVTTAITDPTLSHSVEGSGTDIVLANARVSDGRSTGSSIPFKSPGLVAPRYGDVILELDISKATHSGTYQGGVFTLQAATP